jgi:hypothetical protein
MTKYALFLVGALVVVAGALAVFTDMRLPLVAQAPEPQACTMEAKICPDGSAVGRTGPNCEFAACPEASVTEPASGTKVVVTAKLGEQVEALGETITPVKVLDDSRCPRDVQCVWAGTLHLDATVRSGMGLGRLTFELGKTSTTEVNSITLISVTPSPMSTTVIGERDYEFTFEVIRR